MQISMLSGLCSWVIFRYGYVGEHVHAVANDSAAHALTVAQYGAQTIRSCHDTRPV
jgi:hypothetical protein